MQPLLLLLRKGKCRRCRCLAFGTEDPWKSSTAIQKALYKAVEEGAARRKADGSCLTPYLL